MPRELYRVYVDEAGDRGWGGRSSPVFVLCAVIVRDEDAPGLITALDSLCETLGKPASTVLHWSENVRTHAQRKLVARQLAEMPITVSSVVTLKREMFGSGSKLSDATVQYNYAVRRLLERVSWFVDEAGGEAITTFAHTRNFPYVRLETYLGLLQLQGPQGTQIRWDAIRGRPRLDQPNRKRPLQLADLAAGCLYLAFRPDDFGDHEPGYLMSLAPKIYVRGRAAVTSYGVNIVGPHEELSRIYPWWEQFAALCEQRT